MRKLSNSELGRPGLEEFRRSAKTPLIVVLDHVRSLHNVGAVFRSSDAFGIEKIYLCGVTATPPNKEIQKTALGATETVRWEYVESTCDAVRRLRSEGVEVYAVEQVEGSIPLDAFSPSPDRRYAVVLGNEVFGVDQQVVDLCDGAIEIPQVGTKHSLNVSVCAGVVLWDLFIKMRNR